SEEHTSELQLRFDLVCRLLLEKKKGLPGLHDVGRLAWVLGREATGLVPRGRGRGLDACEAEDRRQDRGRPAPGADRPRGDRRGPLPDDGCESGLGGRGRERTREMTGRVRTL